MPSIEKEIMFRDLQEKTEGRSIFLSNFNGLKVEEIEGLRKNVRKLNANCFVVKKTLLKRYLKEKNVADIEGLFEGHVLLSAVAEEPQKISKALVDFGKTNDKFTVRGAFVEGELRDQAFVKRLSDLPSREVLLGKLLGSMNAPITNFVLNLNGIIRSLAVVLNEVKKQKEQA